MIWLATTLLTKFRELPEQERQVWKQRVAPAPAATSSAGEGAMPGAVASSSAVEVALPEVASSCAVDAALPGVAGSSAGGDGDHGEDAGEGETEDRQFTPMSRSGRNIERIS